MNAYITGTDRGLGLALADKFLEAGFQVFAGKYGIDNTGLEALQRRFGAQLEIVPLDVGSDRSAAEAARLITQKTSSLDLLINNAAIYGDASGNITGSLDFEDMLRVYNVNALGPLRVTHSVLPLLQQGEMKRILNISSEAGSLATRLRRGEKRRYAYCASNAALNMQSIILQNHVAEFGLRVTLIEPGVLRTYLATGKKSTAALTEPEVAAEKLLEFVRRDPPDYLFHDLFGGKPFDW
jgi:NAD(P)-dependent dehydrogenase (short-subunit alcohol dehydrogenase family)